MLDLVARHADAWNGAWYGRPDDAHGLRELIGRLHAALDAVGRPRDSIELTAGIFVATAPADDDRPDEAIGGTAEDIGAALAGYSALGISHLIVHLWPRTVEAVGQLAAAAAIARAHPGGASGPGQA
jgi:alkanesulfonate monooxygenase SsuD/methylene tetrahydromethanopterin reductase-like flavin-dependent oxidoreductase (luciferase family)